MHRETNAHAWASPSDKHTQYKRERKPKHGGNQGKGGCELASAGRRTAALQARAHIVDTGDFYLEGVGLTFGHSDETLELIDPASDAKVCDVAVAPDPAPSEVQFVCSLPRPVASGEYALRLVTRAGGDKLWPLTLKADVASDVVPFVKYIASDAADASRGVIVKNIWGQTP